MRKARLWFVKAPSGCEIRQFIEDLPARCKASTTHKRRAGSATQGKPPFIPRHFVDAGVCLALAKFGPKFSPPPASFGSLAALNHSLFHAKSAIRVGTQGAKLSPVTEQNVCPHGWCLPLHDARPVRSNREPSGGIPLMIGRSIDKANDIPIMPS